MKYKFHPVEFEKERYLPINEVRLLIDTARDKWEIDKILDYLETFKPKKARLFG